MTDQGSGVSELTIVGEYVLGGPKQALVVLKLLTTTSFMWKKDAMATKKKLQSVTPGELLWEEFMLPYGLTRYRLAKEIGVPAQRIGEIIKGNRSITADTDLRLCRYFELSKGYWLRAQSAYDLEIAERAISSSLRKIKPFAGTAA